MKIIYVARTPKKARSQIERLNSLFWGMPLDGQDGFFEAALWSTFPGMHQNSLEWVAAKSAAELDANYEWIIINYKSAPDGRGIKPKHISWSRSLKRCRLALFVNNARADILPSEELLSRVELVFKREPFRERSRYGVAPENEAKLYPAMLSCPLVRVLRRKGDRIVIRHAPIHTQPHAYGYDLSFVGADSKDGYRRNLLRHIGKLPLNMKLGLYNASTGRPLDWEGPRIARLRMRSYLDITRASRISLALPGIGQFTYRHLENWALGTFMLSHDSINEITFPGPQPIEGEHYASFSDETDLEDKIRYYLSHADERMRIARAGRAYFEALYDIERYGRDLRRVLQRV